MELLRLLTRRCPVVIVLAITACLLVEGRTSDRDPGFPHDVHVVDGGLDCTLCHMGVETSPRAELPPPGICALCHDDLDAEKPVERRATAFFDEDEEFLATQVANVPGDVKFSHAIHVGVDCEDCHGDIGSSATIPRSSQVTKDECMTCHADNGRANACAECHRKTNQDTLPVSHEPSWAQRHGSVVNSGDAASINRCDLCHSESECAVCH